MRTVSPLRNGGHGCDAATRLSWAPPLPPHCTGWRQAHCLLRLESHAWARAGTTDALVHASVGADYGGLLAAMAVNQLPPRTILDAGANVGYASALFARTFPNATVLAVEAQPENFAMLALNTAHLRGVRTIHAALSNSKERVFWKNGNRRAGKEYRYTVGRSSMGNGSNSVAALHVTDALEAACLRADTPLDFVKIDIEGSETSVFAVDTDTRWLRRVGAIFIETHDDMAANSSKASMRALVAAKMHVVKLAFKRESALLGCSGDWPSFQCEQLCEQWRAYAQRTGGYNQAARSRRHAKKGINHPPKCIRLPM